MKYVSVEKEDGIGLLKLKRGKVNALTGEVVAEIRQALAAFESDAGVRAVIITGSGKFFSFGFDIPEFLSYSREEFINYLIDFTDLYTCLFTYPKPVAAALNGHTVAGGCMLALACDIRIMASGKAKISLNEIAFGSSVFAGATEMLRFRVGSKNATRILYSGAMYTAEEALKSGLIDEITTSEDLLRVAGEAVSELGDKYAPAFSHIKSLLRAPIAEQMKSRERDSITEFVNIWYSDHTWTNLKNIKIY